MAGGGGGDPQRIFQMMYNKFAELVDLSREELIDGLNGIYGNVSLDWIEAMTRIQNPKTRELLERVEREIDAFEKKDVTDRKGVVGDVRNFLGSVRDLLTELDEAQREKVQTPALKTLMERLEREVGVFEKELTRKETIVTNVRELMERLDNLRDREALQDAAFLAKLNTDIPNAFLISDLSNAEKRGMVFEAAIYFGAHAQQGAEMGIKMPSTRLQRTMATERIPIALGKKQGPKTNTVFSSEAEYEEPATPPSRDYPDRSMSSAPPDEGDKSTDKSSEKEKK